MNRDQKSAVIDEIAASITESHAIFAVDYRGITVEQAKELRTRLRDSDATLRVVKNSLTERAADKAGAEQLKALLEGPTALTFVRGDGAGAAKSIADFARTTQLLAFKGGLMDGATLSPAEITSISRLPSRDVLYGQLVGLIASPISGLARTLNALLSGLAVSLGGVLAQREAAGETVPPPAAEAPPEPAAEAAMVEQAPAPAAEEAAPEAEAAAEPLAQEEAPEAEAAEPPAEEAGPVAEPATEAPAPPAGEESPSEEAPEAGAAQASSEAPEADATEASSEASQPTDDPSSEAEPAGGYTTDTE
jgi:large subunit ribosomal protein L10